MRGAAPQVRGRAEAVISVTSPTSAATVAAAAGGGSSQAQPNKNITSDTRLCRGFVPLLNTNTVLPIKAGEPRLRSRRDLFGF